MKLKERKYTTEKALKELAELALSFSFLDDVKPVESGEFEFVIEVNNGLQWGDFNRREWDCYRATWKIRNGELYILAKSEHHSDQRIYLKDKYEKQIEDARRCNFKEAIERLEEVIKFYNNLSEQKDEEIEEFLKFCEEYKKNKGA